MNRQQGAQMFGEASSDFLGTSAGIWIDNRWQELETVLRNGMRVSQGMPPCLVRALAILSSDLVSC